MSNPAIRKDRAWLDDIATVFAPDSRINRVVDTYCEKNPGVDKDDIFERMGRLQGIHHNPSASSI